MSGCWRGRSPRSGSEKPWHHSSSTDWIFGRKRRFCSSVPNWMSVGANRPSPKNETRAGALARAYSSLKITCCANGSARPPYSSGHDMPDPAVGAEHLLPLDPDVPAGLVGRSAGRAQRRELAGQVLGQPRPHLAAKSGLVRGVAEVHALRTLLDRPVSFLGEVAGALPPFPAAVACACWSRSLSRTGRGTLHRLFARLLRQFAVAHGPRAS